MGTLLDAQEIQRSIISTLGRTKNGSYKLNFDISIMKITKTSHPIIYKIAKFVYPDYTGRKIYLKYENSIDTGWNANWDGGTRTFYKFIRLDNGKVLPVPDFAPWKRPDNEIVQIPNGAACITHSFFQGHDCGLTVILPAQGQIT